MANAINTLDKDATMEAIPAIVETEILGINWGNFNDLPTPNRELTLNEYLRLLICGDHSIEAKSFRSVFMENGRLCSTLIYQFPSYVIASVECGWGNEMPGHTFVDDGFTRPGAIPTGYNLRFFRIGCEHPRLVREQLRMHEYRVLCPDCGWTNEYDTSG